MKFLYRKYSGTRGDWLDVVPSEPATVKFMTAKEFKKYAGGRTHTYYQGVESDGTIEFKMPFDGIWHAVVEKSDDSITASCRYRLGERDTELITPSAERELHEARETEDEQVG